MRVFIVLSAVLVPIFASNIGWVNIEQDTLGNYNLHVETPDGTRHETRNEDGSVLGSYSFVDTNGKKVLVEYRTVNGGFEVKNPAAVVHDTAEVRAAREEHLKAYAKQEELIRNAPVRVMSAQERPVNVAEVLAQLVVPKIASLPSSAVPAVDAKHYAKKAELLKSYAESLERLANEYRSRQ